MLHRFSGSPDGAVPSANLIAINGTLYGTTSNGGSLRGGCARNHGCGVVFAVSPSGSERVIYTFKGNKYGAYPSGPLLALRGMLYGMTWNRGSGRCGTVFKVSTSGKESIIHSFTVSSDACYPTGGLAAINGVLYGITVYGGGSACECGTVFKMTTTGAAKVIYSFAGGSDGSVPLAGLIAFKGALYGTTPEGGGRCSASRGCGTVFRVTTTGMLELQRHMPYEMRGLACPQEDSAREELFFRIYLSQPSSARRRTGSVGASLVRNVWIDWRPTVSPWKCHSFRSSDYDSSSPKPSRGRPPLRFARPQYCGASFLVAQSLVLSARASAQRLACSIARSRGLLGSRRQGDPLSRRPTSEQQLPPSLPGVY